MNVFNILILIALFASCNSQEKDIEKISAQKMEQEKSSATDCYEFAGEADTVTLKLTHAGDSISGYLIYDFKEKDKNTGTIRGIMKGNILLADYTFMSEGIQSTRQVAFKLEGNTFIEGYGDSFSQNDKVYFKNIDSLKFDSFYKLIEIGCQKKCYRFLSTPITSSHPHPASLLPENYPPAPYSWG